MKREHPEFAKAYQMDATENLGNCLASIGRYSEAIPLLRKALLANEAEDGPSSSFCAQVRNAAAQLFRTSAPSRACHVRALHAARRVPRTAGVRVSRGGPRARRRHE